MKEKIIKLFKFLKPVIITMLFTGTPYLAAKFYHTNIGMVFFIIWLFEFDDLLKVMKEYYNTKDKDKE